MADWVTETAERERIMRLYNGVTTRVVQAPAIGGYGQSIHDVRPSGLKTSGQLNILGAGVGSNGKFRAWSDPIDASFTQTAYP